MKDMVSFLEGFVIGCVRLNDGVRAELLSIGKAFMQPLDEFLFGILQQYGISADLNLFEDDYPNNCAWPYLLKL